MSNIGESSRRSVHRFDHASGGAVYFLFGIEPPQSETDGVERHFVGHAHGLQHIAGLHGSRRTRRTAGYRDAAHARHQTRQLPRRRSSCSGYAAGDAPCSPLIDISSKPASSFARRRSRSRRNRTVSSRISLRADGASLAQAHDARHVQRTGSHAALVAAAIHLRGQLHARIAAPHVQRAGALGSIDLVRRDGEQVDGVRLYVHGHLADGLRGVAMEQARRARGKSGRSRPPAEGCPLRCSRT